MCVRTAPVCHYFRALDIQFAIGISATVRNDVEGRVEDHHHIILLSGKDANPVSSLYCNNGEQTGLLPLQRSILLVYPGRTTVLSCLVPFGSHLL